MGKLNNEQKPVINHFSHPHPLHITYLNPTLTLAPSSCSGCKLPLSKGLVYSCNLCKYHLHITCSQMPQQIKHPFDKFHVFSLLPIPVYPEGFFRCDACGEKGNGFSYHCKECGTDLHILCASMPLSTTHHSHHHELKLVFSPAHFDDFSCDVCKIIGGKHWRYRCGLCDFDAHLSCGTSKAPPLAQAPNPTAQVNHYLQTMQSVPIQVVQPPPQMPAHAQQLFNHYQQAMSQQPFNFTNYNTGGTGPNFLRTNSAPPMNQAANSFYPGASQFGRQQTFPVQAPDRTTNQDATLQLLLQLLNNNNGGGGGGRGGVNAQLLQALLNGNGGGGNDEFLQAMMGDGSDGGGFDVNSLLGGNIDMSSIMGGNLDISSLMGMMGGFGLS